jgi:hypothetical protein
MSLAATVEAAPELAEMTHQFVAGIDRHDEAFRAPAR